MLRGSLVLLLTVGLGAAPTGETKPEKEVWRNPKDGMEFVWISPGSLMVEGAPPSGEKQSPTMTRIVGVKGDHVPFRNSTSPASRSGKTAKSVSILTLFNVFLTGGWSPVTTSLPFRPATALWMRTMPLIPRLEM